MPIGIYKHKPLSETTKNKLREITKKRHISSNFGFRKGYISWNKGKKLSLQSIAKRTLNRIYKRGKEHPNWKGGIKIVNNRKAIYSPNHPFKTKQNFVLEHRLIAEKYLKRYLTRKEVIHHKNNNPLDNQKENLIVFPNEKIHQRFHRNIEDYVSKFHPEITEKILQKFKGQYLDLREF